MEGANNLRLEYITFDRFRLFTCLLDDPLTQQVHVQTGAFDDTDVSI